MLLVDDRQAQPLELHVLLEQRVRADHHLRQPFRHQLLELRFLAAAERSRQQHRHVSQLRQDLLEIQPMLGGQDLRRRQDRHLVAVFNGDHRRLRRHDGLAAAHVALQQAVHGPGFFHVAGNFPEHALLRCGRLERQHGLHFFAHAVVQLECDSGQRARLVALQGHAAFQPEELLEDQPELRRRTEGVEQAQVGIRRREVRVADGRPAVRQLEWPADVLRQAVFLRRQLRQDAVRECPQHARSQLGDGLIDRHHAADVQRGLRVVILAREDLEFRVQHGELAGKAVEFHLAVERHPHAFGKHIGQVAAVKPLAHQGDAGGIAEPRFEQPQAAAPEPGNLDRPHFRDDGGHLARSQLRHGLHVAAVFVAERHVPQQILNRGQPFGLQHGRARRADSFDVCERGSEVHGEHAPAPEPAKCQCTLKRTSAPW